MHQIKLMKFVKGFFVSLFILSAAYCNIPLTKHTSIEIEVNNVNQIIKFTFLNMNDENIAVWEHENRFLNWYNEIGYNGNGPNVPVKQNTYD